MAWNWYTKGRRIPTLIGKDVSGRRIPGGPYTGFQAVTAGVVPAVLWSTRGFWAANLAGLAMITVIACLTVGAVKLVGKVDFASRNPLLLFGSYLRQTGRPMSGTLAGRKLAEPRPHRIAGEIDVTYASLEAVAGANGGARASADEGVDVATSAEPTTAAGRSDRSVDELAGVAVRRAPVPRAVAPQTSGPRTYAGQAALQPTAPPAPDRRRSGLETFLAGAAAARTRDAEEEAA